MTTDKEIENHVKELIKRYETLKNSSCQYHKDLPLCACMDCVKDEVSQVIKVKDKQLEEKDKEYNKLNTFKTIFGDKNFTEVMNTAIKMWDENVSMKEQLQNSIPKECEHKGCEDKDLIVVCHNHINSDYPCADTNHIPKERVEELKRELLPMIPYHPTRPIVIKLINKILIGEEK